LPDRGQLFLADGILAAFVLTSLLLSLYGLQGYLQREAAEEHSRSDLALRAWYASSVLLGTPGEPEEWNAGNVSAAGLKGGPAEVSHEKLAQLSLLLSEESYAPSGFLGPGYRYRLSVYPMPDAGVPLMVAGGAPQGDTVVRVTRFALYNGSRARVEFTGWQT